MLRNITVRLAHRIQTYSTKSTLPYQLEEVDTNPLLDTFGRYHTYLRISLTERCNLRCTYCMPSEGVPLSPASHLLTTEEILNLSKLFVNQGISKIRLTGGEPTVRKDLPDIIKGLKTLKGLENVAITTNGLMLTRQLVALQKSGLDSLNISLDTLSSDRYDKITRRRGLERVLAGIDLAIQLGYTNVKINCVVMRGVNDDEVCDFVEWTKNKDIDVRFIEYMPFDGNKWADNKLVPYKELLEIILRKYPNFYKIQDRANDTSKAYRVPGFQGQIGFITSLTEHFCGSCNRLRLTADGNLKVCLFGNTEISLRDALRNNSNEEDIIALIGAAVRRKKAKHAVLCFRNAQFSTNEKSPDDFNRRLIDSLWNKSDIFNSHLNLTALGTNCNNYIRIEKRHFCKLSHVDERGRAKMVDVGEKCETKRCAQATAIVIVGAEIAELISTNNMKKGDVLSIARLAGIMAAKNTSNLIPLCHNIPLEKIEVEARLKGDEIEILATVKCTGKTGVEMEALTAVSIAALTVYDMCKAVSHRIQIKHIKLLKKTGGRSNFVQNNIVNK